jgi:phosphatidylglycerophosphatase A
MTIPKGNRAALWIATWFGCGLAPGAPGTVGSAAAILIAWMLVRFGGFAQAHLAVLALVFACVGVWASEHAIVAFGKKDPGQVVVDEVAGSWLALTGATVFNGYSFVGAFLLFRLFDIWKPFPVRQLERLPGGRGIMADDMMAGLYAALVLFLSGCLNLY